MANTDWIKIIQPRTCVRERWGSPHQKQSFQMRLEDLPIEAASPNQKGCLRRERTAAAFPDTGWFPPITLSYEDTYNPGPKLTVFPGLQGE